MTEIRKILVKHSDNKKANDEIEKEIKELIKDEINNHWYKIKKEEFYELVIVGKYKIHFIIDNDTPIVVSGMDNNGDDLELDQYFIR